MMGAPPKHTPTLRLYLHYKGGLNLFGLGVWQSEVKKDFTSKDRENVDKQDEGQSSF